MFDLLGDAGVVDAITVASREQNAACGRELITIGELYARYAPDDEDERNDWAVDGHTNLVAELSAALNISRGRASARLDYAIALRDRLPEVARIFAAGDIDYQMMAALVYRSDNVIDDEALARLDAAFANWAPKWMKLSGPKLKERIDMWVEKFDPEAVRISEKARDDRYADVGPISPGMAGIWAKMTFDDGVGIDDRLDEVAATVCSDDPRTLRQRRSDAMVAVFAKTFRLRCQCGQESCPAAGAEDASLSQVVVQVIAEQSSFDGDSDNPGYAIGHGAVPASMLREMTATAKLQPVRLPPPCAESAYRPSAALARFVRCRDLACRFPGCDAPAAKCQIDHTIPHPLGPTHPSNLKLLCVTHHLLKTFWTGPGGWADRQLPDGTVIWTAPSGRVYTTAPAGADFFASLATPQANSFCRPRAGRSLPSAD
ncbi:HNH endonuclease signature motif containing protein [Mycobacterium deserti]|uniref:HNH endonuclease n=1 Tax=Mycobacterium deserti TaxID=2978347 RepID=A0ABT2M5I5_9MYCO|nr:HNH endonuclease signature motif containing protein [Mycobacterium deserti]MCT7657523.1 HNH endonuclease [Mycobacterium deserti]